MSTFCSLATNKRRPKKSLSPPIVNIFSSKSNVWILRLGRGSEILISLEFKRFRMNWRICASPAVVLFTKHLVMSVGKTSPVAMFKSWSASSENRLLDVPSMSALFYLSSVRQHISLKAVAPLVDSDCFQWFRAACRFRMTIYAFAPSPCQ